ncbi:MAG: hypothetical protein ABR955_09890 [Verrucomicrobiota bacterium]
MKIKVVCVLLCVLAALFFAETLQAQGTAFTYQGQLNNGGNPANGSYDLIFTLFNTNTGGSVLEGPITNSAVTVSNGLFTTTLNFGGSVFNGNPVWLEIAVSTNGNPDFITLSPLQLLTPTPYAITAGNVTGVVPSDGVSGTYGSAVTFSNSANQFAGNGTGLTSLNASELSTGTVADARLSTNVALLNTNQIFSGVNNFTNLGNSFNGSFFGNGLVGWLVETGTTIQAVSDTGYLLTNSQLVTVTLPASPNIADIVRISGAGASGWEIAQNTNQSVLGNFSSYAESSWMVTSASSPQDWESIASSSDGGQLIAAVYGGGIYVSEDSGTTWTETNSTTGTWRSVACSSNGNKLFAALYGGGIYTNSATGWGIGGSTSGLNWYSVACSSDGTKLVAAAYGSGIYTSSNSGATWAATDAAAKNWFSVASSANGSNLVAVVDGGGIYTSENAGTSWAQQTTGLPSNPDWFSVASSADGTKLVAVVDGGGIYASVNAGTAWTQQTNAPNAAWDSVTSSSDGSKLGAVVYGGGIYISSNYGVTWTQAGAASNNWYAIASSADGGELAATIDGGGIYTAQSSSQITTTTVGTNGYITGGQGTSVELQYIGNNQFMPVSSAGTIWAH